MDATATRGPRGHRAAALSLVVAGTLVAFLAICSLWINRQVMDTDNWTETSSQMLEDKAIRGALSGYLVDQLYSNVDVAAELQSALPPRAQPLAAPAAGALRNLAERVTDQLLQRPRVQSLWEDANRTAHMTFLQIVEGGGPLVSTEEGTVKLKLGTVLQRLADRTGVGGKLAGKVPPDAAQITVFRSEQLSTVQTIAKLLRPLAIFLLLIMLALFGGAVALARARRRETLRAVGIGLLVAGVLALLARSLLGDVVVNSLAGTAAAKPAVESVWRIITPLLQEAATASIGYGVVIILGAWLAGPTRAAVSTRRALAPYLREPAYAYGAAAAIVLLVLIWAPTPATRKFVPALLLIALFALGVEALRRQASREFPGATRHDLAQVLRSGFERVRTAGASVAQRPRGQQREDSVDRLERLAALRDRGVLTEAEFDEQKQEILAVG